MQTTTTRTLYDLVKIKVWLHSEHQDVPPDDRDDRDDRDDHNTPVSSSSSSPHYYILSRYLLARSLQAASISYSSAIKASLLLKRKLVDASILSLDQETLERTLFEIIRSNDLATDEELELWSMVIRFQQSRSPLIILMLGDSCDAKTRVAHALSSRMHFNYVILTDALEDMMLSEEKDEEDSHLFRSVQNDIGKAIKDGKSIIIEGRLDHCIDRFVCGAYDEDLVPAEAVRGGLVTVLQDEAGSPVLVDVARGERDEGGTRDERDEGGARQHAALVVPVVARAGGRGEGDRPTGGGRVGGDGETYLDSGTIPVFELDADASPDDNSLAIHQWVLAALKAHGAVPLAAGVDLFHPAEKTMDAAC